MALPPSSRLKKSDRTRAAILAAARAEFAAQGFERATIRDIARAAAIDPSMVMRYFGTKDDLFSAAASFDLRLLDDLPKERDRVGQHLAEHFLGVWESQENGFPVLLRSAASNEFAAQRMAAILAEQLLPAIAALSPDNRARRRAALVATQILGLAFTRYVLKLPAVVEISRRDIIQTIGETLQRYVCGELDAE